MNDEKKSLEAIEEQNVTEASEEEKEKNFEELEEEIPEEITKATKEIDLELREKEEEEAKERERAERAAVLDFSQKKQLIECALFMAPRVLNFYELKKMAVIESESELKKMLNELKKSYESNNSGLEIIINEETRSAGLRPKGEYMDFVKDFAVDTEFREAVKKTLALIAYLQPAKQSIIAKYRGNKSYDHIKYLLEKGLISKKREGPTFILGTTKKFLDYFNLSKEKKKR